MGEGKSGEWILDGWASLSYVDGDVGFYDFKCLNMCYISVSMDVNGAVIQERVACMRAILLEV